MTKDAKPKCNICGAEVWNSQFSMLMHLIQFHPMDLVQSRGIQDLFERSAGFAFKAGNTIGRAMKGDKK